MTDAALDSAIDLALSQDFARVRPLDLDDGRRFWLKRSEMPSLRMRLQKGDPRRAFLRELNGLLFLGAKGQAVPPVVAQGPGYFVLPDVGPSLRALLWRREALRLAGFAAAGTALGDLHRAGYCHGRPAIRDICWDGTTARFLDLERFSRSRNGVGAMALDLGIFLHSIHADGRHESIDQGVRDEVFEALFAYRRAAPPQVWAEAQRRAGWLAWLVPLARLRPASREWAALAPTLAEFRTS